MSKYFTDEELNCNCGCKGLPPASFIEALEELRVEYGLPMVLNSAYRCANHPIEKAKAGGSGAHSVGAVDVRVYGNDAYLLVGKAIELGWTGIGLQQMGLVRQRYVHIDIASATPSRPRPWIWTYPAPAGAGPDTIIT